LNISHDKGTSCQKPWQSRQGHVSYYYSKDQQNVQKRLLQEFQETLVHGFFSDQYTVLLCQSKRSHEQTDSEVSGSSVTSCCRCPVNEIFALLGCYSASIGPNCRPHLERSSGRRMTGTITCVVIRGIVWAEPRAV
jgi:hypothetical protein